VHVWCYWRRVLSLWRAPRPTAVSAVWRSMCYTRSACTGDSAATGLVTSLFFVIMAANGATMSLLSSSFVLRPSSHLSWSIVPYSGAPISLRRYCTSQPQYASRELQIVRDTNAEKHRLQFTLERQGSAVPSSGCVVKRPRRAPVKALTVYPQKWGTSRMSRPYHRKITLSVI